MPRASVTTAGQQRPFSRGRRLIILALVVGKFEGATWLDPIMGIVGGLVIIKWRAALCKHAAFDLLDVELSPRLEDGIRSTLEHIDDVRVSDLHVWSLSRDARACVVCSRTRPTTRTFSGSSDAERVAKPSSHQTVATQKLPYDKQRDKARSEIECSTHLLKPDRRFATRYEKTLRNSTAVVALGCCCGCVSGAHFRSSAEA